MRDIYCSTKFKNHIRESFDFFKNLDSIKKAGEQGGGASGELFFITHDKASMFKTISNSEAKVFETMIEHYTELLYLLRFLRLDNNFK